MTIHPIAHAVQSKNTHLKLIQPVTNVGKQSGSHGLREISQPEQHIRNGGVIPAFDPHHQHAL